MVTLHVFNPEHDLALAFGGKLFTPPHAARELRTNMGFLPALWAQDGDIVLVDDVDYAVKAVQRFSKHSAEVLFLSSSDLKKYLGAQQQTNLRVAPWGWDEALCHRLICAGVAKHLLPSAQMLAQIRTLSSREQAGILLAQLRKEQQAPLLVGESWCCRNMKSLHERISQTGDCVLKAPWSSSGRGIRYVMKNDGHDASLQGWMKNVLEQQGQVVVEPFYRKVRDFAMEFFLHENGTAEFLGFSLFHTKCAAYTGNLLATESEKRKILCEHIPSALLDCVAKAIIAWAENKAAGVYTGPFGVDMMIVVEQGNYQLHPCVEINLRRTMGHVALALSPTSLEPQKVMRIVHDVNYRLCVTAKENNFVDVV